MSWPALETVARLLGTDPATLIFYCGTIDPATIVLMLTADFVTWASYMAIGVAFLMFILKSKIIGWTHQKIGFEVSRFTSPLLVTMVGAFVVLCGFGHMADILASAGHISQWARAVMHGLTALVSAATAFLLFGRAWRV